MYDANTITPQMIAYSTVAVCTHSILFSLRSFQSLFGVTVLAKGAICNLFYGRVELQGGYLRLPNILPRNRYATNRSLRSMDHRDYQMVERESPGRYSHTT